MAEAQIQSEEQEYDETAQKAAEIGKQLGVDDENLKKALGEPVEEPEYEVVIEEDEKIAKEREPAKRERKPLSNKEKRELRKKRLAEKFDEKDSIIQQQQEKLEQFERWKNEVEGRLTNVDKGKVDEALYQTQAILAQSKKEQAAAINEGRGEDATAAQERMYDAAQRLQQLQMLKQQLDKAPAKPQANSVDSSINRKKKAWESKHSWYNSAGTDEDSAIAQSIAGLLVNEGFDPKSDDYWEELDERLVARGIGEAEEEIEEEPKPRKRQAPPVSGGSQRNNDVGGRTRVHLDAAFVQTLKDSGIWEDPERKRRVIENHIAWKKANPT